MSTTTQLEMANVTVQKACISQLRIALHGTVHNHGKVAGEQWTISSKARPRKKSVGFANELDSLETLRATPVVVRHYIRISASHAKPNGIKLIGEHTPTRSSEQRKISNVLETTVGIILRNLRGFTVSLGPSAGSVIRTLSISTMATSAAVAERRTEGSSQLTTSIATGILKENKVSTLAGPSSIAILSSRIFQRATRFSVITATWVERGIRGFALTENVQRPRFSHLYS